MALCQLLEALAESACKLGGGYRFRVGVDDEWVCRGPMLSIYWHHERSVFE